MKTRSAMFKNKYFSKIFPHESENSVKCSRGIKKLFELSNLSWPSDWKVEGEGILKFKNK